MLDLQVRIEGEKIVINGLQHLANRLLDAVRRGLTMSAMGVHRRAYDFLSGGGAKGEYSSGRWKRRSSPVPAGGYPVPVRTGHLRRMLDWLKPGETKTAMGETFTAGPTEAVVYNSAEYARVIHEGLGTSRRYGPRPYLTDALERFNEGGRIAVIFDEEIRKEIKNSGI